MKKINLITAVLLFVLMFCTSCVGTYFVNFALKRQTFDPQKMKFDDFSKSEDQMTESELAVKRNGDAIEQLTLAWLENQTSERWTLTSSDGLQLVADYYPYENSHRYAILVHGYTGNKHQMLDYGKFFHDWGFNVLTPDNRAHGESQGQWIGMGWLDSYDQLKWINRIVEMDPDAQITMLGVSMGGATVMMTSGLDLPSNVKCLIEDCGYSSVWDEFANELKVIFHLNTWPLLNIADGAAKRTVGYGLKEASSMNRLENAKVPMLFIHGTADDFVSYSMLDENIASYGGPAGEVLRVEGAGHARSLATDYNLYTQTVRNFVFKYIN